VKRPSLELHTAPGPPAAVFFDLDDTLFDHVGTLRTALRAVRLHVPALRRFSLDLLVGRYLGLIEELYPEELAGRLSAIDSRNERFRRLLVEAGVEASRAEAAELSAYYRETYQRARKPTQGARELLRSYRADGIPVGVITNNRESEQVDKLEFLGLAPFVDHLVTSEAVGYAKPNPRIFREALHRVRVAPAEARMVGDSWESDVLGAATIGLPAVWFNRREFPAPATPHVPRIRSLSPVTSSRRRIAEWQGSYRPRAARAAARRRPKE
jgi:HAD superfamily hydrolase (TIGR01549 family)